MPKNWRSGLQEVSTLSLLGAGFYGFVAVICGIACFVSTTFGRPSWHRWAWAALFCFFCVLLAMRVLDLEELSRDLMRDQLRSLGAYEGRRETQSLLAVGLSIVVISLSVFAVRRGWHKPSSRLEICLRLALLAAFVMVALIGLRLISLHSIDAILYGMRLNWVIDLGSATTVAICGIAYVRSTKSASA